MELNFPPEPLAQASPPTCIVYQRSPLAAPESKTGRMCGWIELGGEVDSRRKRSGPRVVAKPRAEDLERHPPVMLEVVGE
jgi:hypothetical protein